MCSHSTPSRDKFTRTSPTQVEVRCAKCDRVHFVAPSRAKRQSRFYCDITCRDTDITPLIDRFHKFVVKPDSPDDCWGWSGFVGKRGYAMMAGEGYYSSPVKAHRVSYEHYVGAIPDGMVIDHICRNRACVNPGHMRVCTQQQNTMNQSISTRNKSGYIGVHWDESRKVWVAMISTNGKSTYVGRFVTAIEAARARDTAAIEIYGEFASLNFPDGERGAA